MKPPEHLLSRAGQCFRCGLGQNLGGPYCPPGFWMTKREIVAWEQAGAEGRKTVEARALAVRGRSAAPSSSQGRGSDG